MNISISPQFQCQVSEPVSMPSVEVAPNVTIHRETKEVGEGEENNQTDSLSLRGNLPEMLRQL